MLQLGQNLRQKKMKKTGFMERLSKLSKQNGALPLRYFKSVCRLGTAGQPGLLTKWKQRVSLDQPMGKDQEKFYKLCTERALLTLILRRAGILIPLLFSFL